MASKLKLTASPTFKAKVPVPVAGGEAVDVEMTFKHRTKTDLDAWVSGRAGRSDEAHFLEMVEGWELEEEFNAENVKTLCENYIGVALATYLVYIDQLVQNRIKN